MVRTMPDGAVLFVCLGNICRSPMAEGALRHSRATLAVSITGIAGPGGSEFKPEGRVCFGIAREGRATRTETIEFGAPGRDKVRRAARDHALQLLAGAMTP